MCIIYDESKGVTPKIVRKMSKFIQHSAITRISEHFLKQTVFKIKLREKVSRKLPCTNHMIFLR